MKNTIILLILSCITIYSQDFEPTQQSFNFLGNPNYYLSADSSYFKQTNFILGWAWGCGRKMSEALMDNQANVGTNYQKSDIKNNTKLVINADYLFDHGAGLTGSNSQSMYYSPVLYITNNFDLQNRNILF